MYEKSKAGVTLLFQDFDLPSAVKDTNIAICQMLERGSLAIPDEASIQ